jgi:hypothetical protein
VLYITEVNGIYLVSVGPWTYRLHISKQPDRTHPMNYAAFQTPGSATPVAQILDEDLSMSSVANALLACHARGADGQTMLSMAERLLSVTERELLERERRMMAEGDPDLANHVRRHGDLLLILGRQVRDSRRSAAPLSHTYIRYVGSMVERMRAANAEAA